MARLGTIPSRIILPWVLLAVVVGFSVVKANQASERLRELRHENATLTIQNIAQGRLVAESEREVARRDSIADEAIAAEGRRADAAVRDAQDASARLRGILGENVGALEELDAIEAAHAIERGSFERREAMMLAQIASRDDLMARQREQIAIQASIIINLRGQVSALDPPFFVGLFRDIPKLAIAAGVGVVAGVALSQ